MTPTFEALPIAFADDERRPLAQPSAEPLTGEIMTAARILTEELDGRIVTGTWECQPGMSRWEFTERGEFIHVLAGRMVVTEDGAHPVELVKGSTAVFPLGWKGTWDVTETLRKVFVVYRP
ncbi:MAG: hypothetical protein JWN87_1991 [Frankiales bacterium]|jgi:uncharacterized cupin superfamily protein|nr:hypothetical protein [Frankiales bacterium]MCW2586555.1 hypothetical protein [Frankiales bacterium]